MSYRCGTRPGGNQRWSVAGNGEVTIMTKLDGKCLGYLAANTSNTITAELHESTLASVFFNRSFVGTLDNQGHNGHETSASISAHTLPSAPSTTLVEVLSSTVGISADIASMRIAMARSVEYLGLASLKIGGYEVAARWTMQAGTLGEALKVIITYLSLSSILVMMILIYWLH